MPTYAILGATGYTGRSILTLLLKDPNNKVHAYVRSKSKLLSQRPDIEANKEVKIFEGALNDVPLLASCLSNVDTVFSVLGENDNTPGMRIGEDGAQALVAALTHLRFATEMEHVPRIIMLSSSSVNPGMMAHKPRVVKSIVGTAFSNAYADLRRAEAYLRLHKSWLSVTFIQPGALTEDEQKGHTLSTEHTGDGFVSYLDLAAGMIEVANSGGYGWMGVSVNPTGKDVKFEWKAPKQVARGLVWHFAPSLGWAMKHMGLF
ncbi:NAD(P)-binding domain [Lasallia pustulata]|uniref:NAD(P)-binding domain n=1 Tax=Lasallia pustulata TaxID=136370 RepID=A0A1W5CXW3_9LECA|nr:NAD(P)-binding domain [Lasallia pustulata]